MNVTRRRSDRHARGSWTVFDAECLRRRGVSAKEDRAGWREHTCDNRVRGLDIGTVHGAYLSGRLAAEEALRDLTARDGEKMAV